MIAATLAWNRWYSIKIYLQSSLWVVPIVALMAGIVLKQLAEAINAWAAVVGIYDFESGFFGLGAEEAHAVLERIFNLNLSCLVFAFSSLLVAIQVAGGQYTPRIIATTLLRDNVIRWVVGLFVFSMLWAHRTMVQIGRLPFVPEFQVLLAVILGLGSLIAFIVLIDYCAKFLRPVALLKRIGDQGIDVILDKYPLLTQDVRMEPPRRKSRMHLARSEQVDRGPPARVIHHEGRSGIVLAVNYWALLKEAVLNNCVIEMAVQAGDFLGTDDVLFNIYGHAGGVEDPRLCRLVALGSERNFEQDPLFAFRIVVDIALKALSPAINDPTTAVLAIDQLQRLLGSVGKRSLRSTEIKDSTGQTRVIMRIPGWQDFVEITFREIRHYGASSIQVDRRLRAAIYKLIRTLPAHRHAELQLELELLDRATAGAFAFAEDVQLARIPDSQGLGGTPQ